MATSASKDQTSASAKITEGSAAAFNQVQNIIAVMSGKGGVGKSFVTGLLASALAKENYRVGIMDADITGPSIPMLFGLHGPVEPGEVGIHPLESHSGVKVISMNLLLASEDQAVIWRGPMISKAIKQLWGDVMWGQLDYLLIDLPPGTSDAALTIMQSMPIKGIVMVTTPQGLASMIVRKAVHMAQTVGVPILGVVENMAYFTCPDTGKKHYVFGDSNAIQVAQSSGAPILAQIPINPDVARACDHGLLEEVDLPEMPELLEAFTSVAPVEKRVAAAISQPGPELVTIQVDQQLHHSHHHPETDQEKYKRIYSPIARMLIESRENMGGLDHKSVRSRYRGWCGDSMQIDLLVEGDVIRDARYTTDGCGATIACGSMVTRMAKDKTLSEAQRITPEEVIQALEGLPKEHEHCAQLAINTLRQAINDAIQQAHHQVES
ncbi:MAG: P-loop NTPase [Chloroflexi bacterium]|nr:P-loop NTPase [Chloroflexota bacterium]